MDYNKDFLTVLFQEKMNNNQFYFHNAKLDRWRKKKQLCINKLYDFINKKINPNARNELKNLIEDYKNVNVECFAIENELYYKKGVKDGIKIHDSLKKM